MSPPDPNVERAIDRAVGALEKLFSAELRGIRTELVHLNRRLDQIDHIEEEVSGLDSRLTSAEAFISSHERHIRWRWDHLPGFVLSGVAVVIAAAALLS